VDTLIWGANLLFYPVIGGQSLQKGGEAGMTTGPTRKTQITLEQVKIILEGNLMV